MAKVLAAGTLTWRVRSRRLEVVVVHRPRYDDWSWPKGKLEQGESLPECAVRETQEEAGLPVCLGQPLGTVSHRLPDGRTKVTSYWAAQELSADSPAVLARAAVSPAERTEIDGMRWVDARRAKDLLTYERDLAPLEELIDQYDDGKLASRTVLVLRHARATKRSAWRKGKGEEHDRPLTVQGTRQADAAVGILAAFGVEDVVTSPWERCVATVRPYLEATGLEADTRPELTEAAHERARTPVRRTVRRELTTRDVPVVLCVHRPTLPTIVETIAELTPRRIFARLPARDPWLRTGEALVVHIAPPRRRTLRLVALERVRPVV